MENLLLTTELSRQLFLAVAKLPIIDFHNHLPIKDIVENRQYRDLTELWIASDPYKHRAMRICGVPERLITGKEGSPKERFLAWANTAPQLLGNPLWHWTCLELLRVFGIEEELTPDTAEAIWQRANELLATPEFRARAILDRFNIEYSAPCSTLFSDDVELLSTKGLPSSLSISLRGDDLLSPTPEMLAQLDARLDRFHAAGCRIADHALDAGFRYEPDQGNDEAILADPSSAELVRVTSAMLRRLAKAYAQRGWILQ